jgi:hypothetical protein
MILAVAKFRYWHFGDIASKRMNFRFRWKNGHAADIIATSGFGPEAEVPLRPASSHNGLYARRAKRYRIALCNIPYRYFAGCVEHPISNRANMAVDTLEIAQDVKMEGQSRQTMGGEETP